MTLCETSQDWPIITFYIIFDLSFSSFNIPSTYSSKRSPWPIRIWRSGSSRKWNHIQRIYINILWGHHYKEVELTKNILPLDYVITLQRTGRINQNWPRIVFTVFELSLSVVSDPIKRTSETPKKKTKLQPIRK